MIQSKQKAPKKIIKDDPLIGKYKCPSDGRTYEITHIEKDTKVTVCGHCINCKETKGIVRMSYEEFQKQVERKVFIKK